MVVNHGFAHTFLLIKEMNVCLLRNLSNRPVTVTKLRLGLTTDGLPKLFGTLIPLIRERDKGILRFVLTVMTVPRIFNGDGKDIDLNPIELRSLSNPDVENQIAH